MIEVLRYAAFSNDFAGGNPAGVVLGAAGLDDERMRAIAAELGYAETAFVTDGAHRPGDETAALGIRYFSPHAEVPFCGHATVATAIAIAERGGPLRIDFATPVGVVTITTERTPLGLRASFTSVPPRVAPLPDDTLAELLALVGLPASALDPSLPPMLAYAGNWHPVLAIADRSVFDGFAFDPAAARALMDRHDWLATITVLHRLEAARFEARNIFPVGSVVEDPATGAAAAAVGGYLRALGGAPDRIVIEQGRHVGRPGVLEVDIPPSGGIVVSGQAVRIPDLPDELDLRLVAADMDGTLLDAQGQVPDAFWPLLDRLTARGILFVPASGRQYETLRRAFGPAGDRMAFIAENGTYVVREGVEVSSNTIDPAVVARIVALLREIAVARDIGVVVCGKASAYIERADAGFLAETEKYYARLTVVPDVLDILAATGDGVLKIAVFDFGAAAGTAAALAEIAETHQVVVSGAHWVDVMNRGVDKGRALRALQRALGVTAAQTAAFGDYLNDLELLDAADLSFAMANAHPDVLAHARFHAPANVQGGVMTVLETLLGR